MPPFVSPNCADCPSGCFLYNGWGVAGEYEYHGVYFNRQSSSEVTITADDYHIKICEEAPAGISIVAIVAAGITGAVVIIFLVCYCYIKCNNVTKEKSTAQATRGAPPTSPAAMVSASSMGMAGAPQVQMQQMVMPMPVAQTAVPVQPFMASAVPVPVGQPTNFDPMTGQPIATPVAAAPWGSKFDPMTGQPLPKFDPQTGQQNWGP